jgi:Mg2+ and Co2+ transporter CorA
MVLPDFTSIVRAIAVIASVFGINLDPEHQQILLSAAGVVYAGALLIRKSK